MQCLPPNIAPCEKDEYIGLNVTLKAILDKDKPYFYNANPIDYPDGQWLPFENMLCQLFTNRMEKYK